MRLFFTAVVTAVLILCPLRLLAEEDAFFLRDAFADRPEAGYRWAQGWSVGGRVEVIDDDNAFGESTLTRFMLFAGKRTRFDESENWRTFWDIEIGGGYADGGDVQLGVVELGGWLGAEAYLAPRLSLAARVGAVYAREELSNWATRTGFEAGRAQVELIYYW